jgi:RNA polymerase sigma factor (TIGR02999 family)
MASSAPVDDSFAELYEELRRLAHAQLRRSGPRPTLSTTAVVHETYLKLAGAAAARWENDQHFLSLAARAMRQVVVDYARSQATEKRGGTLHRVELPDTPARAALPVDELLAIDRGIEELERADPRLARMVELRFFGGLENSEIAAALALSERSVERDWRRARALLLDVLAGEQG